MKHKAQKKKGTVPRGEHHKEHHRAPENHREFHQLGNDEGDTSNESDMPADGLGTN